MALIEALNDPDFDSSAKDAAYAALVRLDRMAPRTGVWRAVLWLGVWPGLDAVYRENIAAWAGDLPALCSEISFRVLEAVDGLAIASVHSVPATLVLNVRRDVRRARRRELARAGRTSPLDDDLPPRVGSWRPEDPARHDAVRRSLRGLPQPDQSVLWDVVVLGEKQNTIAARMGRSHDGVRKHYQRALGRLREKFDLGLSQFMPLEPRFSCTGRSRPAEVRDDVA